MKLAAIGINPELFQRHLGLGKGCVCYVLNQEQSNPKLHVHTCQATEYDASWPRLVIPGTQETEAGGWQVPGLPGLVPGQLGLLLETLSQRKRGNRAGEIQSNGRMLPCMCGALRASWCCKGKWREEKTKTALGCMLQKTAFPPSRGYVDPQFPPSFFGL